LHLRTGNARRINRQYPEALAELKKAVALDPNLPGLYLELGLTYIGLKDTAAAQAALEEEIRRHSGSAEARLTLGELFLILRHDYSKALENIRQAQRLGIQPARAEFDFGEAYMRLNQIDLAEKHLKLTVKLDSQHRRAHYLLAKVYQRQGKKGLARKEFAIAESIEKQEQAKLNTSFRSMIEGKESKETSSGNQP